MVGEFAPNFKLKDQHGNEFELNKNPDQKILLVFYPKDNSPVCTNQLTNYNQNLTEFAKLCIQVVGINTGDAQSHNLFCNNLNLDFLLLSDVDKTVSKQYNAVNKFGINKRKIVLIDTDKRIIIERATLPFYFLKAEQIIKMHNS